MHLLFWSLCWFNLLMRSNETNYYMQTYLHLLISLKRFGRYTQTVRYTLRERKFLGTKIPRSESSIELSFPGAKRPGSERAWERKGQGAKGPRSESSRERIGQGSIGRFAPGSELARERKGSVPGRPASLFTRGRRETPAGRSSHWLAGAPFSNIVWS